MYNHILIPTDGSTLSEKAAREGTRLARDLKAKVTALYVIQPFAPPSGEGYIFSDDFVQKQYMDAMRKHAQDALDKVKAAASAEKVDCEAISIVDHSPWEGIINAAKAKQCDAIVMASHGRRGLEGVLLGSETTKVLTHSKTPVLVCR